MSRAEDESKVKAVYLEAKVLHEVTYGRSHHYTCMDPITRESLGPTTFTEDNAWKWAAERLP